MADTYLEQILARRHEAGNRMKDILSTAASENRELTAEENTNLEAIDSDLNKYQAEEKRVLDMEAKLKAADEVRAAVEPAVRRTTATPQPTDRDTVRSLFAGTLRGADFSYSPEFIESRALANSGATGGTTMPVAFADFVAVYQRTLSPVLQVSNVIQRSTGETLTVPRLTTDTSGSLVAEAATIPSADPTISSVSIVPYKYAVINVFSQELENDNTIGLDQLLARSAGRDLGLKVGTDLTTGDGNSKPKGYLTGATNGGTAAGTPFFTAPDIITLFYSLAQPYRQVGSWMLANGAISKVRKFTDTNGQFLWGAPLTVGQPETLLGRPVFEDPNLATPASATKSVAFGDFSAFTVVEVVPMRVERSAEWKFDLDQIALKTVVRYGSDLPDAIAIKYLVSANT